MVGVAYGFLVITNLQWTLMPCLVYWLDILALGTHSFYLLNGWVAYTAYVCSKWFSMEFNLNTLFKRGVGLSAVYLCIMFMVIIGDLPVDFVRYIKEFASLNER